VGKHHALHTMSDMAENALAYSYGASMTKIKSFTASVDHIKRNFDLKEDEKEESKKVESAVKVYSKMILGTETV
jgi:hypothetical protein